MNVSELEDKAPVEEIVLKITDIEEPRDTQYGKVQNATGEDETGSVQVTLWRDDVGSIGIGDTVKISKGWSKKYQDQMQVSKGKYGTLEKVE